MTFVISLAPTLQERKNQLRREIPYLTDQGATILELALETAVTVVYEEDYICKDYRNLYSNFFAKKYRDIPRTCYRLHFFKCEIKSVLKEVDVEALRENYIGYSVIRPLKKKACIGRTVFDPATLGLNDEKHFYCLRTKFRVHLYGFELVVNGYPFCAQDGEANTCSHTALWTLCRYMSERYHKYRELYPYDFVTLSDARFGRPVPYNGLSYHDYCEILSNFGCHPEPLLQPKKRTEKVEWTKDLYAYLESGFPILASYGGHVVNLIGHTIDYDRKPQRFGSSKKFIDSCSYMDALVVIDDSFAPFQLLGRETGKGNYGEKYRPKPPEGMGRVITTGSIHSAVCPLPEKVFLPADSARELFGKTLDRLVGKSLSAAETYVVRMFVTTAAALRQEAFERNIKAPHMAFAHLLSMPLPHFVWVLEIATPQGYRNRKCIGEILVDATAGGDELASIMYARVNGAIMGQSKGDPICFDDVPLGEQPQFVHNLGGSKASEKCE